MKLQSYEFVLLRYPTFRAHKQLMLYAPPCIIVAGTFGNLFAFFILRRGAMRKISAYLYLMALCVTDTIVLYAGLLRLWLGELTGSDVKDSSDWTCKATTLTAYTISDLSVWIIVVVTWERYRVTSRPFRASGLNEPRRVLKIICLLLTLLLLVNLHFLWTVKLVAYRHKGETFWRCGSREFSFLVETIWPWVDAAIYSVIPSVLVAVLNALIVFQVCPGRCAGRAAACSRSSDACSSEERVCAGGAGPAAGKARGLPRQTRSENSRITAMLLTVSCYFLLTALPMNISLIGTSMWTNWRGGKDLEAVSTLRLVRTVTELLMYCNHAANFYLYLASGTMFRNQVASIFCKAKERNSLSWHTPEQSPTASRKGDDVTESASKSSCGQRSSCSKERSELLTKKFCDGKCCREQNSL